MLSLRPPSGKSSEVGSIFDYVMQSAILTLHKVVQSRIVRKYWHQILRRRLKVYAVPVVVPILWRVPKSLTKYL
eukprot:6204267-Pleurochrysis_carterae.AAC.1